MLILNSQEIIGAIVFFLPAYVANTAAGFFGGGRPIDFGKNFSDGRRFFGDGKTFSGTLIGILAGVLYKIGENFFSAQGVFSALTLALLLSTGAMAGDIGGSFFKRRIGIASGESAPFLDQLDFVIGALFLAGLIVELRIETVIILLIITPIGHLGVNIIGFLLHKKEVPW
jgi:CDP-2,3-bis-(O-geranylgeranyl)-sn-glycerol synthase